VALDSGHNSQPLTTPQGIVALLGGFGRQFPDAKMVGKPKNLTVGGKQGIYAVIVFSNTKSNPGRAYPQMVLLGYAGNADGSTGYLFEELNAAGKIRQFPAFVSSSTPSSGRSPGT